MGTKTEKGWQALPPIELPSPIYALTSSRDGVWAGGTGGVAWYPFTGKAEQWQAQIATLPLSSVTTLFYIDGLLLAGGAEGIAYSRNGGAQWQQAQLEDGLASITAFAISPRFAQDGVVLAATMTNGIIRSDNSGRTWVNASFGLESFEVTALLWAAGSTVLAAAADGIYRSSNAGRAWRRVYEGEELGIDAITAVSPKTLLAVLEAGGVLRSEDGGVQWSPDDDMLQGTQIVSLQVTGEQALLAGTLGQGLLRSSDGGVSWEKVYDEVVLTLICGQNRCYAGSNHGMSVSDDDGHTWHDLPSPPVHDLRHLLLYKGQPLVMGSYSGTVRFTKDKWIALVDTEQPLTDAAIAPDGTLLLASGEGLTRTSEDGESLHVLIEGIAGQLHHLTFRAGETDWKGWAVSTDGTQILHSSDSGATWQALETPFGVLPVVALQAIPQVMIAATYDPRQYRVCIWTSSDDGKIWERSAEAEIRWPVVATCADLALVTLGNIFLQAHPSGRWNKVGTTADDAMIRRVVSTQQNNTTLLFALTTAGIQRSKDNGATWQESNADLPKEQILDIIATDTDLYALLAGGYVWKRTL